MTATFDLTLPTAKDRMRAAVGDRAVPEGALRQDEEYYATLALADSEALAVAVLAEGLAAEYAQRIDSFSESGGISVRWSERVKTWLALAKSIRDGAASAVVAAGAGSVNAVAVRAGTCTDSEYLRSCDAVLPSWWMT